MEVKIEEKIRSWSVVVLKVGVVGFAVLVILSGLSSVMAGHEAGFGDSHSPDHHHHHCSHGHHHHHHDHHHHHSHHDEMTIKKRTMLPEELAEEEDLKLLRFGGGEHHHHHHDHHSGAGSDAELSGLRLWIHAMGCSLLVSLASLICLIILPIIFIQGKPSKAVVDSLALFGAGAMLGDAFLHQLPHAFGGAHSHSHDHDHDHLHGHSGDGPFQSHAHSLEGLSVGLSILAGIILFFLIEKLVRYVEDSSGGANSWSHDHHHHHHHKKSTKLEKKNDTDGNLQLPQDDKRRSLTESEEMINEGSIDPLTKEENYHPTLSKRNITEGAIGGKPGSVGAENGVLDNALKNDELEQEVKSSNLVFGYLNLFSDGVHNFTDGMALGSAFLLYGSIGGWSRTLFLLAHELPQEIGDFGILVRSGFSVSAALFFNFLSALVALAGTGLALIWGRDTGNSSLIEGLTAGGFIYIAIAGVLAEMNNNDSSGLKSGAIQLVSLVAGMAVALGISLVE